MNRFFDVEWCWMFEFCNQLFEICNEVEAVYCIFD